METNDEVFSGNEGLSSSLDQASFRRFNSHESGFFSQRSDNSSSDQSPNDGNSFLSQSSDNIPKPSPTFAFHSRLSAHKHVTAYPKTLDFQTSRAPTPTTDITFQFSNVAMNSPYFTSQETRFSFEGTSPKNQDRENRPITCSPRSSCVVRQLPLSESNSNHVEQDNRVISPSKESFSRFSPHRCGALMRRRSSSFNTCPTSTGKKQTREEDMYKVDNIGTSKKSFDRGSLSSAPYHAPRVSLSLDNLLEGSSPADITSKEELVLCSEIPENNFMGLAFDATDHNITPSLPSEEPEQLILAPSEFLSDQSATIPILESPLLQHNLIHMTRPFFNRAHSVHVTHFPVAEEDESTFIEELQMRKKAAADDDEVFSPVKSTACSPLNLDSLTKKEILEMEDSSEPEDMIASPAPERFGGYSMKPGSTAFGTSEGFRKMKYRANSLNVLSEPPKANMAPRHKPLFDADPDPPASTELVASRPAETEDWDKQKTPIPFRFRSVGEFGPSKGILPTTLTPKTDVQCISPITLTRLLKGDFDSMIDRFFVVDCRFPYEYEGGHIRGALNLWTLERTLDRFLEKPREISLGQAQRTIIVFHCEFSAQRGPDQYTKFRMFDNEIMLGKYRFIYPEIYLLEGGYEAYFDKFPTYCEPQQYVRMKDQRFTTECAQYETIREASMERAATRKWESDSVVQKLSKLVRENGEAGLALYVPPVSVPSTPTHSTVIDTPSTPPSQILHY